MITRQDIELDYLSQPEQPIEYSWSIGACVGFFAGSVTGPICALKSGIVLVKAVSFGICLGGVAGAMTGGVAGVVILAGSQLISAAYNKDNKLAQHREREPMNIKSDSSLNLDELPYYVYCQNLLPFLDIETIENLYNVNRKFRQVIKNAFRTNPTFLVNEINKYRIYNYSLSFQMLSLLQSETLFVTGLSSHMMVVYLIELYGLDVLLLQGGYSCPSGVILMPFIISLNITNANKLIDIFKEECIIRETINSTNEDMFEHRLKTKNKKIEFSDVLKRQFEAFMNDDETNNHSNYKNNSMLLFGAPLNPDTTHLKEISFKQAPPKTW